VNLLKNLLILAVLGAVGYGVYVSLARNNTDSSQPPGVAEGWPAVPKVELPSAKPSTPPGGPLALGGAPAPPAKTPGTEIAGAKPPVATPPVANPTNNPLAGAAPVTPATPYPSSSSPSVPATAPTASPSPSPASPTVTLGPPTSPTVVSPATPSKAAPPLAGNPVTPPPNPTPAETVRNLAPPPEVAAPAGAVPPAAAAADSLVQSRFAAFMDAVQKKLDEGKLADAHLALSSVYANPDLPPEQAKQITNLLDQLAGTVIYSRKHLLEPAYLTQQGDTLEKISQKYSVPWQLLARINGLMPPVASNADNTTKDRPLPVGMALKVVRGPFDAVVRLDKHELTLTVQDRYAGRFPIGVGRDQPKLDGSYMVRDKALGPTYYGPDGVNIDPNDPKNPLGGAWIGLTDRIGIHGTNDPQTVGRDDNRGTICVGDRDLQDLYGILSVGSRVTILR
jgi:hypothetical protein